MFQGESGRWTARITVSGKKTSLGTFDTEAAAAAGYDSACFVPTLCPLSAAETLRVILFLTNVRGLGPRFLGVPSFSHARTQLIAFFLAPPLSLSLSLSLFI